MLKKIIERVIIVIAIITIGMISVINLFYTSKIVNDLSETVEVIQVSVIALTISLVIVGIFLLWSAYSKKIRLSKKGKMILLVIAVIFYILLNFAWLKISRIEPVADQKTVNQIAEAIVNGKTEELNKSTYLERNPQQIGISYFIAGIYKIFHSTDYHIIQYLNIICNIISIMMLYVIAKRFLKEYVFDSWIYFMISFTFIPLILLTTFVYGDYIGLMFSILGIYNIMKYIDTQKIRYIIFSGIMLGISYIVKSNYLIIVLACIIYLVLNFLKQMNWKEVLLIALFVAIAILPNTILNSIITNQFHLDKSKSIPTSAYIYMGMNEGTRANGWYNTTMDYAWNSPQDSHRYYPLKLKERIIELLQHPFYTVKFYADKTISMWTEATFGGIWYNLPFQTSDYEQYLQTMQENKIFYSVCEGKINWVIESYQKALVILIFFSAFWAIWKQRKNVSLNLILLVTIVLGGFFFHTIWEAKSRYILPYVVYMIPISIIGIQGIVAKLFTKSREKKDDL